MAARRPSEVPLGGGRPLLAGWGAASEVDAEAEGPALAVVTARQRESECRLAAEHLWRILASSDAVGAEVEATYWANEGALTMLSWCRTAEGERHGAAVDGRVFVEKLWHSLLAYVGEAPRAIRLVYGRWYNAVYVSGTEQAALAAAEQTAMRQLQALLAALRSAPVP